MTGGQRHHLFNDGDRISRCACHAQRNDAIKPSGMAFVAYIVSVHAAEIPLSLQFYISTCDLAFLHGLPAIELSFAVSPIHLIVAKIAQRDVMQSLPLNEMHRSNKVKGGTSGPG